MLSICCVCAGGIQTSPKHTAGCSNMWSIQTYGVSKHEGHPNMQGACKCMRAYGHYLSVTKHAFFVLCMYGGIQTLSKHTGVSKHMGHPNIQGVSTHGGIQTYRGPSKHTGQSNVWGIWTPLSVTKHAFFVLCMYRGHPNIFQTYRSIQTYGSVHTYSGGIQT